MKNREIASSPNETSILTKGILNRWIINWKPKESLSNDNHKNKERTKVIKDVYKETRYNLEKLEVGINNKRNILNKGKKKMKERKKEGSKKWIDIIETLFYFNKKKKIKKKKKSGN